MTQQLHPERELGNPAGPLHSVPTAESVHSRFSRPTPAREAGRVLLHRVILRLAKWKGGILHILDESLTLYLILRDSF